MICLQSLLVAGSIFAFCNLQIHKTVSSTVMEAFASDKTLFLQYPTSDYLSVPLIKMRLSEVKLIMCTIPVKCYSVLYTRIFSSDKNFEGLNYVGIYFHGLRTTC